MSAFYVGLYLLLVNDVTIDFVLNTPLCQSEKPFDDPRKTNTVAIIPLIETLDFLLDSSVCNYYRNNVRYTLSHLVGHSLRSKSTPGSGSSKNVALRPPAKVNPIIKFVV